MIGADSTLACNGRLFDKPATLAAARRQLLALRGQTHELFSSVVVAQGRRAAVALERAGAAHHAAAQRTPSSTPISRAPARPCCASVGAYQLEGLGAHLFSRIEGDYFTILGLPLLPLLSFLARHGIGLEQAA